MNENIDLTKILKGCPKGTKLYSPIFGDCEFDRIVSCNIYVKADRGNIFFYQDATLHLDYVRSKEPMLFPSREERDWSKFKVKKPKFDPKTLNPFEKVLVRDSDNDSWCCDLFSHIKEENIDYKYVASSFFCYRCCIPYNDDTKHLVGTSDEAPEYYRYWED